MYHAKATMLQEKLQCYCSTNKAILRTPSLKSVKFKTDPDPPGRKILFRKQATKGLSLTNKGE